MQPINADQIFLWARSETHFSQIEFCESYSPSSFSRLQHDASEFILWQLDEFYQEFCDWIQLADFPDVEEQFLPSEEPLLASIAGLASAKDHSEKPSSECFSALCGVIRHRLNQQTIQGLIQAANLFNYTIEYGVWDCVGNPYSILIIGSADAVAPALLDHLSKANDTLPNDINGVAQRDQFQSRWDLLPVTPILQILISTVEAESLSQNTAALQLFNLVFQSYRAFLQPPLGPSTRHAAAVPRAGVCNQEH